MSKPPTVEPDVLRAPQFQISKVIAGGDEALSIQINQTVYELKRAGRDVTTLSLGEAFFEIPMFDFGALDFAQGYHYSDSQGTPGLRAKIADYYGSRYGASVNGRSEVLITAGSKVAIFLCMLTALNPGDEVAIHEPCWLSYPQQARLCGATPVFIPYDVEPGDFGAYLSPRTKMLIVNNPNNPSGRVYDAEELAAIHRLCSARGIYVLVDEAYSDFVIDREFPSMAAIVPDKKGMIVVNSLSKNMGMSGWRIGYVIAEASFIQELLKANQHLVTCAPTILLTYCERYFDQILAATLPQVRATVDKRNRIRDYIDRIGLTRLHGDATFYFFVGIGNFPGTSMDFAMHLLLNERIAVVPGAAYGQSTDRFVRISVGVESEDRVHAALVAIKALSQINSFTPYDYNAGLAEQLKTERHGNSATS
jgi:aspartate/methionine/tyrosine aminotransferase